MRPSYLLSLPTECVTPAQAQRAIDGMIPQLFVIGGGRWITAIAYNVKIQLARRAGKTQVVKSTMEAFINFTLQAYYANKVTGGQTPDDAGHGCSSSSTCSTARTASRRYPT